MRASYFFWIGPGVDYDRLIASLTDEQMRLGRFYIVNTLERGKFLDIAKARYEDVDVTNYTSLDSVNDPPIYDETRALAAKIINAFSRRLRTLAGDDSTIWKPHVQPALAINFGDHLYSSCRALALSSWFIQDDVTEVVVVEISPRRAFVVRAGFRARGLKATILTDHLPPEKVEPMCAAAELKKLPQALKLSGRYPSSQIHAHQDVWLREQTIFVASRLRDDMFVSAVMPVIRELTNDFNVFIYDQQIHAGEDAWRFEDYGIHDAEDKIYWARRKPHAGVMKFMFDEDHPVVESYKYALKYTNSLFRTDVTPLKLACRELVVEDLQNKLLLVYMASYEMSTFIEKNSDLFVAAMFCPGRILESLVACETFKMLGRPTFDLQSGTISPTRKFIAPTADNLIAIDELSADVLNNYHGYPADQTFVVGSPRLDYHLAQLRAQPEDVIRRELGLPMDRKIITFMSQPIGLGMLETIVRTLAEAATLMPDEILWLIKPHPREHQAFYDLYQRVIEEVGAANVVVDQASGTYPLLKASDAVVTYCSTAGLEAFALGKPVYAINPLDDPMPYDLVELGVAVECRDAETLAREVAIGLVHRTVNEKYYLQDGKSAIRAADVIRRAIVNPRLKGNGGVPENPAWVRARDLYDRTLAATLGCDLVD